MASLKRFYLDNGDANPEISTVELGITVHALYTHWVRAGYHRRDFSSAMTHEAELMFGEYLLSGRPDLTGGDFPLLPVSLARDGVAKQEGVRFYDELCDLNLDVKTELHRPALSPHFCRWVAQGCAPRDFTQAIRAVASAVIYDHEICMSLGGMGGCRSSSDYLSQPYRG